MKPADCPHSIGDLIRYVPNIRCRRMRASYGLIGVLQMLKIGAGAFTRAMHQIGTLRGVHTAMISSGGDEARDAEVHQSFLKIASDQLAALRNECVVLEANVTLAAVDRLVGKLRDAQGMSQEDLVHHAESIESRLFDELTSKELFVLTAKQSALFKGADFSHEVISRFPSAAYDLDEAAKCLGLSRSTASVFHLMRAMESALRAIHLCLKITSPSDATARNWGAVLNRIRDNIKGRGNAFAERDLFQEMYALLDAVKDAWRNGTMHVEDKKTESEAEAILIAVRSFMTKVASRMDEHGQPPA